MNKTAVKVGIIGATGYAGAELVRILLGHPYAQLTALGSVSFEGRAMSEVYPSLRGLCDLPCVSTEEVIERSDVVFACVAHGLSQPFAAVCAQKGTAFIDLGADFVWQAKPTTPRGTAANLRTKRCTPTRSTPCRSSSVRRLHPPCAGKPRLLPHLRGTRVVPGAQTRLDRIRRHCYRRQIRCHRSGARGDGHYPLPVGQ